MVKENIEKGKYICTLPRGRLGNLLFEFAAAIGISRRLNRTAIYDYKLPGGIASQLQLQSMKFVADVDRFVGNKAYNFTEKDNRAGTYDPRSLNLPHNLDVRLVGYYQSWKYFDLVASDIRREFTCSTKLKSRVHRFLSNVLPRGWLLTTTTLVGVHGRRGDMTTKRNFDLGYSLPNASYYATAMKVYRRVLKGNILFIVASDDNKWAEENIVYKEDNIKIVHTYAYNSPLFDMCILSECDHSIISSGSFSWWAGWLANGQVIYFNGYPRPFSILGHKYTRSDYYLPRWIPLDQIVYREEYAVKRLKSFNFTDFSIDNKLMN